MKLAVFFRSGSHRLGVLLLTAIGLGWTAPVRAEALVEDLTGEIEAQIEDMGDVIETEIRDRIDPEAIERAARPIVRRSLRTVLDVAPEMSRRAIIVGEWYLGQWGDRALEELENAVEKLDDLEDGL